MALVSTPAVILRTYRYSETSKVVRLATRELGVQSAIAKGALRPRSPFGAGLELLSEGVAQLYHRDSRDLQTLAAFDVVTLRRELAGDLGRFAGATTLAELMVKMAPAAPLPVAYDTLLDGLDALATAAPVAVDAAALRALWRLLAVLGFEPSLATCVRDDAAIDATGGGAGGGHVLFSPGDGGVVCGSCAAANPPAGASRLPPQAYRDLIALNDPGVALPVLDAAHAAAHRRLVARFTRHHLGGADVLPALEFWERRAWVAAS